MKKDIKNISDSPNKITSEQDHKIDQISVPDTNTLDTGISDTGISSIGVPDNTHALAVCQKELQELKDKFLRVNADLYNFQSRMVKERTLWTQEAQINIFKELLPILDDFERAVAERQKFGDDPHLKAWLEGFELIGKSISKLLCSYGVHEIDCSGIFDPHLHEALLYVADQQKKAGEIVAVLQKGYQLKDTVIRPAKVSVAR